MHFLSQLGYPSTKIVQISKALISFHIRGKKKKKLSKRSIMKLTESIKILYKNYLVEFPMFLNLKKGRFTLFLFLFISIEYLIK